MGVNIKCYVVKGYRFSDEMIDNLSDEFCDELLNMSESFVNVSPMTSSEGVFGEILFKSNDGRYEEIDFDLCLEDMVSKSDSEIFRSLPDYLKYYVSEYNLDIKIYMFMCYS